MDARTVRALGLGFNVLVPELRGHPPSGGERHHVRHFSRRAISSSSPRPRDGPVRRRPRARLGIDGCSMGALVALHSPPRTARPGLWLSAPFGDLRAMAVALSAPRDGLPPPSSRFPAPSHAASPAPRDSGSRWPTSTVARPGASTCPTVVVHGEDDGLVPIRFAPSRLRGARRREDVLARAPLRPLSPRRRAVGRCAAEEYERRWTAFFRPRLGRRVRRVRRRSGAGDERRDLREARGERAGAAPTIRTTSVSDESAVEPSPRLSEGSVAASEVDGAHRSRRPPSRA